MLIHLPRWYKNIPGPNLFFFPVESMILNPALDFEHSIFLTKSRVKVSYYKLNRKFCLKMIKLTLILDN